MSKYIGSHELYFRVDARDNPVEDDCRIIYDKQKLSIKFQRYDGTDWVDLGRMFE